MFFPMDFPQQKNPNEKILEPKDLRGSSTTPLAVEWHRQ
jgi:hypothetical protein